jgi:hypothetical protein
MILKDGESLVHLGIRIKKEMSELSPEDAKLYVDEAVSDIFIAAKSEKIPLKGAIELIKTIDPEFYTKPNQLRKSAMTEAYMAGTFIVVAGLFGVMALGLLVATILSF